MIKNSLNNFFKAQAIKELSEREKILIIDGHNLIFRMLFVSAMVAKKDLLSESEMYDYWKHLIVNNILNLIKSFKPMRVIFTIDSSSSWRKQIYADYKAKRKVDRDNNILIDFKKFWPIMDDFIKSFSSIFRNILVVKIDGCEGDDIIAVITKKEYTNNDILIITSDKDFIQLLSLNGVSLYNPIKRKFIKSIDPKKELEIKIISGDPSDFIPSIKPRCRAKTAEKMLREGIDIYLQNQSIKENYERNKKLIDFDYIPEDIKNLILNNYNNYKIDAIDGTKLMTFLSDYASEKIVENYSQYSLYLKQLR